MSSRFLLAFGALAAMCVVAAASPAHAQIDGSAARYATVDERRVFVLDRSADPPVLQIEGSPEVFALSARPAARGDLVFRLDTGADILRLTDIGGATLYPPERSIGVPAERMGPAEAIAPPDGGQTALIAARETLLGRWREAAGVRPALIDAEAAAADPSLTADAIRVLARAVGGLRLGGAAALGPLSEVRVSPGAAPGVAVDGAALTLTIVAGGGYAGRPSSHRILDAIAAADLLARGDGGLAFTSSVASPAGPVRSPQN